MANKNIGLRIGIIGFVIALLGALTGFSGFHIEERWLSVTGFVITVIGVIIGFIGIVYGWMTSSKQAIGGSIQASKDLRTKMTRLRK